MKRTKCGDRAFQPEGTTYVDLAMAENMVFLEIPVPDLARVSNTGEKWSELWLECRAEVRL